MTQPALSRRSLLASLAAAPALLALPSLIRSSSAEAAEGAPANKQSAVIRRRVGDIELFALADGFSTLPGQVLLGLEDEAAQEAARIAHKPHDPAALTISINTYLIRSGDRLIAVDTGATSAMAPTLGAWRDSLAEAGIAPQDVDTLFLTHAHADHVGGMTDASGARLLPNAQLVLADAEWAFTHDDALFASLPADIQGNFRFSRAQLAPYAEGRKELAMARESEITPGVTALPMPGHTPGHMGLRLDSQGEVLLIWGDVVHAPAYQFSRPDWSIAFDADIPAAIATRQRFFDMAATDDVMVAGMHLDFPALGFVERHGNAYRYLAAPPDFRA
ncbi:MBL fold metallo-hydrolase [Devosia sp.]|uniref:MBL fold metallo-hydrolase n=1 Tax=Devosia sp. TaxID=1871048 RepID=UPI0025E85BDF|nr:MBL fold metallo-hydrolase [Devosia sp.]MCR6635169.1 MBL fold metallo-hydrolase [Devosia sp.]